MKERNMKRFGTQRAFLKTDFKCLKDITTDAAAGIAQPEEVKPVKPEDVIIKLPAADKSVITKENVYDCIADRKSVRKYSDESISMKELSYLLWASQGIRETKSNGRHLRTVPSAGCTHTFETYLFIKSVEGLQQGIYRYLPLDNALLLIKSVENMTDLIDQLTMAEKQPFVPYFAGKAAVIFAWSTLPYRAEWKFDIQAHKKILIDIGHVCQNLYIAGESIDTGICAIGIYNQEMVDEVLGLDGEEELVVYLASAGKALQEI